jgi:STE24 endopeptidase
VCEVLRKRPCNEATSRMFALAHYTVLLLAAVFYFAVGVPCSYPLQASERQASLTTDQGRQDKTENSGPAKKQPESRNNRATGHYQLSEEKYQKAVAYSRAGYTLYFVSVAWSFLVLLLLLQFGVIARLRDAAERASGKVYIQAVIFVPALLLLLDLFHLPISLYWHSLSLRYEQSVQGWGSWMWDWSKATLLEAALSVGLGLLLFVVIRWKPRRWWLYFWFAAVPVALFLFFISPWFIDPMFHKFRPLQEQHPELVESIGRLTERAGVPIPPERMFLMEASAKTNELNAYVTGIGASKRVVIWDTTIQKTSRDELLFIVGHELGHYALGHVFKGFALFLGGLLVALSVADRALQWVLTRWGPQWGARGQGDWVRLAILLLIMKMLVFLSSPMDSGASRMIEHAADVYGLEVIHGVVPNSADVAANAFQILGEVDLDEPNPPWFIKIWLYSHPPISDRLSFAYTYDPWSKGQAPKYVK